MSQTALVLSIGNTNINWRKILCEIYSQRSNHILCIWLQQLNGGILDVHIYICIYYSMLINQVLVQQINKKNATVKIR